MNIIIMLSYILYVICELRRILNPIHVFNERFPSTTAPYVLTSVLMLSHSEFDKYIFYICIVGLGYYIHGYLFNVSENVLNFVHRTSYVKILLITITYLRLLWILNV